MLSKLSIKLMVFCFLLAFTAAASATSDNPVKQNKHASDAPSVRYAYANLTEDNVRNSDYKIAMAVQVIGVRNTEQKPISRLFWGCACGLAFLGVIKRRLNK